MSHTIVHDDVEPAPRALWFSVGALLLGTFLGAMDTLVVITALPTIGGELGGRNQLAWVLTSYMLASTATAPIFGKLGDLFGRRRLYQLSIAIFLVGSVLCGLAANITHLIAARTLQGIGAGGLTVLPIALVGDVVPHRQRARYQGVMGANFTAAILIGPILGGFLVDHGSWRGVFFINVPLGLAALAAAGRIKVPSRPARSARVDVAGSVLVVLTAVCVLYAVTTAGDSGGWSQPGIVVPLALAPVLLAALVVVERRAAEPVLPPRLFRNRTITLVSAGAFFFAVGIFGAWVLLPIFLQVVVGASVTNSGLLLLPLLGCVTISSIVCGRLITRWNRYRVFPLLGLVIVLSAFVLYTSMGTDTSWTTVAIFEGIAGIGVGMNMQVLVLIGQNAAERRDLGVATATVGFFRQLGASVGTATSLTIFNSQFTPTLARSIPDGQTVDAELVRGSPSVVRELPDDLRDIVIGAFADSLHIGFVWLIPTAVVALVILAFLREESIRLQPEATAVAVSQA